MKATSSNVDRSKLYTSTEARKLLDISGSTLKNLVEKGIIERVVPYGYAQGFYTKESVDEYHKHQEIFTETYTAKKKGTIEVRKARREDEAKILEMEREVLGATIPLDKRLEWHIKNPEIDFVAISNDVVAGHLSLLPLKEETLTALLKGEIRGWHVTAEEVEAYQLGKQYNLFVMAMAVRDTQYPGINYGALLLREAQTFLFELANKDILIKAIYATSRTRDGIYFANRFGMETLPEYSTSHRHAFRLDLAKSDKKWARQYREYVSSLYLLSEETQKTSPQSSKRNERQENHSHEDPNKPTKSEQ